MLEHVHEFPLGHHGLFVTTLNELLLELEARALVYGIVEFAEAVTDFRSGKEHLETLDGAGTLDALLGER